MEDRDFRAAWQKPISREEWGKFLHHNFHDEDRKIAWQAVRERVESFGERLSMCEVGFGQAYDFAHCFRQLVDADRLEYTGLDITEQFVAFAEEELPGYDWRHGDFDDLACDKYDITYTAKTLEHQPPEYWAGNFRRLLSAARNMCVVIWFKKPRDKERICWCERDGFGNEGAWGNIYARDQVLAIIDSEGFGLNEHPVGEHRSVYVMHRNH